MCLRQSNKKNFDKKNERKRLKFIEEIAKKCWSGVLTIKESIKWLAEDDSIIIDNIGPSFRAIIIRFLMIDKNQSEIERTSNQSVLKAIKDSGEQYT